MRWREYLAPSTGLVNLINSLASLLRELEFRRGVASALRRPVQSEDSLQHPVLRLRPCAGDSGGQRLT